MYHHIVHSSFLSVFSIYPPIYAARALLHHIFVLGRTNIVIIQRVGDLSIYYQDNITFSSPASTPTYHVILTQSFPPLSSPFPASFFLYPFLLPSS